MSDRIVVITGASSGIGAALAEELARRGDWLTLAARRERELRQVVERCGPASYAVVADVTRRDDVRRVKPDPELFLLAASRLGVAPAACLVFEDSPNGMRAALDAGMRCAAVPNALTRPLARPEVDLVLESLAERPLAEILRAVEGSPAASLRLARERRA